MRSLAAAPTMEALVNAFIQRALESKESFQEVDAGFGGLRIRRNEDGTPANLNELSHAIADYILGRRWWYTLKPGTGRCQIEIEILGGF